MTNYRLYPTNPAVALVVYNATPFQAGICFQVTKGGMFFQGYWWYVPADGDTASQKFCLYSMTSQNAGTRITAADVVSGTLTANSWNFIALAQDVQLSIGSPYCAMTAWQPVAGFPANNNQFGSGNPFAAGITNGPLQAFSDQTGSLPAPYTIAQGMFGTASADPTTGVPGQGSNSANYGMDLQVTDVIPVGGSFTYRLWPNKFDANAQTGGDAEVPYTIATEIHISPAYQYVTPQKIWFFSPSGSTVLPSKATVWSVQTGLAVATISSPSWSGAAGTGFLSASFSSPPNLLPGKYKVSVYAASGASGVWGAKDTGTDYWGAVLSTGWGANGITWGPISAPNFAGAAGGFNYNISDPGSTPPYTDGTTNPAQSVFAQTPTNIEAYPQLVALVSTPVAGSTQNYWVDLEVAAGPLTNPSQTGASSSGEENRTNPLRKLDILGLG